MLITILFQVLKYSPFRTSSNIGDMSAGTTLALIMSHTQPDTSSLHTDREEAEAASLSTSTERNIDKRINDILGMASNVIHGAWSLRNATFNHQC